MKNRFEINGKLTWLFIRRKNQTDLVGIIDTTDLPKVMSFPGTWGADYSIDSKTFYVRTGGQPKIYLHRFLLDAPKGSEVDHKNHNGLDNRRENIHTVDRSANQQNRIAPRKGSLSGVQNVTWVESKQRWLAHLMRSGERVHLGHHRTVEEAAKAVREWKETAQ